MPRTATLPSGETITWDGDMQAWLDSAGSPIRPAGAPTGSPADTAPAAVSFDAQQRVQPGQPAGFAANLKAGFVDDEQTKIRQFSEATGVPVERFTNVDGQIAYYDDEGTLRSAANNSAADKLGDLASVAPEVIGGVAGSALGPAGSALGTVAGVGLKKIFAGTVLDEPQTTAGNVKDMAIEAGLDVAFGAVGAKAGRLLSSRAGKRVVPDIEQFNRREALATMQRIEEVTGIKLDVAQASGLASLLSLRKWAFKYPNQASSILQANRQLQEGQSEAAVTRIMGALTEGLDNTKLASDGINAAQASINLAKQQRKNATQGLYRTAFDGAEAVDTRPLLDFIDAELKVSKGERAGALRKMRSMLQKGKSRAPEDSLEALHNVKTELDLMVSKDPQHSAASLAHGAIKKVRGDLVSILEEASPVYKTAQEKFAMLSEKLVDPLEDGMIGALAKVKGNKNVALTARWLAGADSTPQQVSTLRRIIEKQPKGRETWRGLLRVRLSTALDKASRESQGGFTNIGPKFRAELFATPNQRAAWRAAMPGDVLEAFDTTMEAFQMIAKSGTGGSDTAFNLAVESGIRDAAPFSGVREGIASPLRGVANLIVADSTEEFVQKNAIAIAEAMVDPAKISRLAQLRKGGLTIRKAAEVLGITGALTVAEEIED